MSKGQQQAVSAVLITGILIGVVASVYYWGVPIIQKSQDRYTLEKSEEFMAKLNERITEIANNGGRDRVTINVPGILSINDGKLSFVIETQGTIYSGDAWISLTRSGCDPDVKGIWGTDSPQILCVRSDKAGEAKYITTHMLTYRELQKAVKSYKIELAGSSTGGEGHSVVIEKTGVTEEGSLIKNVVNINII